MEIIAENQRTDENENDGITQPTIEADVPDWCWGCCLRRNFVASRRIHRVLSLRLHRRLKLKLRSVPQTTKSTRHPKIEWIQEFEEETYTPAMSDNFFSV